MASALVIRRALGTFRDSRAVAALCEEAQVRVGPALQRWLSTDADGVMLLAERGGRAIGLAVLRLLRAPGGDELEAALLDAVYVVVEARRQGVGRALVDAARGESEAREAKRFTLIAEPRDESSRAFASALGLGASTPKAVSASPALRSERVPESLPAIELSLAADVTVRFTPDAPSVERVARWSGAQAIRTRWRADLASPGWSVDECVGTSDDDGDAMRFDPKTGALRETWFNRPSELRFDDALLARVSSTSDRDGVLIVVDRTKSFALPPTEVALFDVSLACLVALRREAAESLSGGADALSIGLCSGVSALFVDGRYAGWRARDPLALARPMGWPETREPRPLDEDERAKLASLLYDWMVIDASPRIDPADAKDPEDIAHMLALRQRVRALAEIEGDADERNPAPGVARDVAAQILWGWGFYKIGA